MNCKPYPEYKESGVQWLGQVPRHWDYLSLKWISQRYAGGTPDKSNDAYWENGDIPWLNSGSVNDGLITVPSAFITREGFANSSAKWIPKSALVMALAGQGKTKGMVAQLGIRATCNQSMTAIIPKEKFSPRFLYWWLVSNYQNIRNMAGGEQRDGLNLDMLGSIPCPLLPLLEQTSIVDFLDRETGRIDTLVAKKRRLIALLGEKRTALISRTVTRGLPADAAREFGLEPHTRFKDSGIEWLGEVPEGWTIEPLKNLATPGRKTFTDGDWVELPFITDYGIRLLQTGNVGIGKFKEQGFRYISNESFNELRCTEVQPNDVLICRLDGPVGRACLAPDLGVKAITSVDNTILKCCGTVSAQFVVYLLSTSQWLSWIDALCRVGGGFRVRISRIMLGNIRVPKPPLPEQTAIATYLDRETATIDQLVTKVEAAIARLLEYRTALITAAVTGKIDVRDSRHSRACGSTEEVL